MNKPIRILLLLLLCLGVSRSWASGEDLTVKGKIEGIDAGRLLLIVQTGESRKDTLGVADFKAPRFTLKASLREPASAMLIVEGYNGGFQFFAEPGTLYSARLKNDESFYIRGGKLQDAYDKYAAEVNTKSMEINRLEQQYDSLKRIMKYRSASVLNDSIAVLRNALQAFSDKFHADNDNLLTAYEALFTAQRKDLGYQDSKKLYDQLGEGARLSLSGRILAERIQRLERLAAGKPAPDFTLPTLDGKSFTLSQMKGKIKIVDFWASWCGPCRLNNPSLKKLYAKYQSKGLEMVSVSLDDNRKRWNDAVIKDGLPWVQVSSLKGWKDEIVRTYNVTAIPAIFILDEDNRIIARDIRGEALENFLADRL